MMDDKTPSATTFGEILDISPDWPQATTFLAVVALSKRAGPDDTIEIGFDTAARFDHAMIEYVLAAALAAAAPRSESPRIFVSQTLSALARVLTQYATGEYTRTAAAALEMMAEVLGLPPDESIPL